MVLPADRASAADIIPPSSITIVVTGQHEESDVQVEPAYKPLVVVTRRVAQCVHHEDAAQSLYT